MIFKNLVSWKRQFLEWKIHLDLCVIHFMWSLSSILSSRAPSPWASCFSSAWLCQQRSWNWNSSVVRPSVHRQSVASIIVWIYFEFSASYCMDLFRILVVASLRPYPRTVLNFWKKKRFFFYFFLPIFFISVNMGPHGSKKFKTLLLLQITAKSF